MVCSTMVRKVGGFVRSFTKSGSAEAPSIFSAVLIPALPRVCICEWLAVWGGPQREIKHPIHMVDGPGSTSSRGRRELIAFKDSERASPEHSSGGAIQDAEHSSRTSEAVLTPGPETPGPSREPPEANLPLLT